jgi:tetratricopeptide (TPR) repeat protein
MSIENNSDNENIEKETQNKCWWEKLSKLKKKEINLLNKNKVILIVILLLLLIPWINYNLTLLCDFYVNKSDFKKALLIQKGLYNCTNKFILKNTYYPIERQYFIGNIYFLSGNFNKALESYKLVDKNIKITKFNKNIYYNNLYALANLYFLFGNYDKAIDCLNKISINILLKNNDICTLGLIMNLYIVLNDNENSKLYYNYLKNIEIKNDHENYLKNINLLKYKILKKSVNNIDNNIILQLERYLDKNPLPNSKCNIYITLYEYYKLKNNYKKTNIYLSLLKNEINKYQPTYFDINLIFIVSELLFNEHKIQESNNILNSAYSVYQNIYFNNKDNQINICYLYYKKKYFGNNSNYNILCENLLKEKGI